jgi:DnaK suppressor protein
MPLTREQTEELGSTIEQRRRALVEELREDLARSRGTPPRELSGAAPDPGDESVADLIGDLDRAEVARELDELRNIEAAKRRLEEGSYGECIDCGLDIGYGRLRANPSAVRCIICQTRYEKTFTGATGTLPPGSSL